MPPAPNCQPRSPRRCRRCPRCPATASPAVRPRTLTGPVVLATMPASFVTQTATFDATVGLLEGHLSGADTTAGLMSYFNAHRSIFDTACFTVAQYTTQADATSALTKVVVRHTVRAGGGGRRHRERSSGVRHLVRHCVAAPGGDQSADAGRQSGLGADLRQRELPPAGDHLAHADLVQPRPRHRSIWPWNDWARTTRGNCCRRRRSVPPFPSILATVRGIPPWPRSRCPRLQRSAMC